MSERRQQVLSAARWLAALALLATALSTAWVRLRSESPGVDYYQFWIVGRAREVLALRDAYSEAGRASMAGLGRRLARETPHATRRLEFCAGYRDTVETFGTPFLYALVGGAASGDYDTDLRRFQTVSIAAFAAALAGLCAILGWGAELGLAAAALACWLSDPLASDVRTANLAELQLWGGSRWCSRCGGSGEQRATSPRGPRSPRWCCSSRRSRSCRYFSRSRSCASGSSGGSAPCWPGRSAAGCLRLRAEPACSARARGSTGCARCPASSSPRTSRSGAATTRSPAGSPSWEDRPWARSSPPRSPRRRRRRCGGAASSRASSARSSPSHSARRSQLWVRSSSGSTTVCCSSRSCSCCCVRRAASGARRRRSLAPSRCWVARCARSPAWRMRRSRPRSTCSRGVVRSAPRARAQASRFARTVC